MENLLIGFLIAAFGWAHWFLRLRRIPLAPTRYLSPILLGVLLPLVCWTFLLGVLARLSSKDVQSDPAEIGGYWLLGVAWIGASQWVFGLLGVSMRDDVLERRNTAAACVVAGQLVGLTCCFAGANIGNGPGPQVVIFSAALSTASLVLLWLPFDRLAAVADRVTIDRDVLAGIRAGGWFAALGIVLGAGVAGDWHSVAGTLFDFAGYAWPGLAFTGLNILLERGFRDRTNNIWIASPLFSAALALAYIGLAVLYVYKRGLQ